MKLKYGLCFGLIVRFALITVFLLLNACSTVRRDGPPSYYVDASKIPDAVPKVERLSKYGNNPVYRVRGKDYHVMASSKNYEEQGIASWYGTLFHARHTSSGERYNMLSMTAAHKTLPLPTYVQVTNLKNHKKIIVKVNDRGPFEDNRLIDLSYVAAKKLGMLGHGTAFVDVKAIDPMKYDRNLEKPIYAHDFYLAKNSVKLNEQTAALPVMHHFLVKNKPAVYLQVGAFKNKIFAERLKKRIGPLISSPIRITHFANKKKLYRVQIGPIKNIALARHITKQLKAVGLSSKQTISEV